jgi:Tol biopolymer transport system component
MHLKGVLLGLAIAGLAFASVAEARVTERVSVESAGAQANAESFEATISSDGQFVAFRSGASNLVAGDTNGADDIFVRDRASGLIERVSVSSAHAEANSQSRGSSLSGDGTYVAFASGATNLVPADTNGAFDVFVRDLAAGLTERVSVNSNGQQGNGSSGAPAIGGGGQYVAFSSGSTNLVAGDTNGWTDVFVHDRVTGLTERVSVDSAGVAANGASQRPVISADGRYVAFWSQATNLVPGDTNGVEDVFVHDRTTGSTQRVSVASDGAQADRGSFDPAISPDGRYVAFWSPATNLVADDTNTVDVFVHDLVSGSTERVSVSSGGEEANGLSRSPAVSDHGRVIAFMSDASNLVTADGNSTADIFVHDRESGVTKRVSVGSSGAEANDGSVGPAISADGRVVAFESLATNLVADDTNGLRDIFAAAVTPDRDGDGVEDSLDNCPDQANADQQDSDGDGTGDACDRSPRGPQGQIADLIDHTLAALDLPRLAPALKSQLEASLKRLLEGNKGAACNALRAYELLVQAAPRNAFSADEKAALVAESRQIRSDLACA